MTTKGIKTLIIIYFVCLLQYMYYFILFDQAEINTIRQKKSQ